MTQKLPKNPSETNWDDLPEFMSYFATKDAYQFGVEAMKPENLKRLQKKDDAFYWSRMFKVNGQDCIMRLSFEIIEKEEYGDGFDFRPDA